MFTNSDMNSEENQDFIFFSSEVKKTVIKSEKHMMNSQIPDPANGHRLQDESWVMIYDQHRSHHHSLFSFGHEGPQ